MLELKLEQKLPLMLVNGAIISALVISLISYTETRGALLKQETNTLTIYVKT